MPENQKSVLYHPTAYHEAGHAVMAYFLGVRIKKVTIVSGKDYLGRLVHGNVLRGRYWEFGSNNRMEKNALIALAGDIAQRLHAPRSISGASKDHDKAYDMATRVNASPEAAVAWIKWLKIRASDILKVRWSLVDSVARELVKRNELNRDQVAAVILSSRQSASSRRRVQ